MPFIFARPVHPLSSSPFFLTYSSSSLFWRACVAFLLFPLSFCCVSFPAQSFSLTHISLIDGYRVLDGMQALLSSRFSFAPPACVLDVWCVHTGIHPRIWRHTPSGSCGAA
ncbi:hypothetical protein C8R45DRAFT_1014622 [Mycena sanguinolenta]|nr:hypothetical protein C8R45DRAFT_1014622 [Mycena sanguinolenta]